MRERPTPEGVGPGRESAWDYPRPPRVESTVAVVRVEFDGEVVAETQAALRVLETSHPPGYYLPAAAIRGGALVPNGRSSWCEFKGRAVYFDLVGAGRRVADAAWSYPEPTPGFEALAGAIAFYPERTDGCWVDGERVRAQAGSFYGGWVTDAIVGPFKGQPGTSTW